MKNLALLISTNVLFKYLSDLVDPFLEESKEIIRLCAQGEVDGYIAFHTVSTLWYVLRKWSLKDRRAGLEKICSLFSIVAASKKQIIEAIKNDAFDDFENCLQDEFAKEAGADYIVTCNVKDYENSFVPALSPRDALKLI